MPFCWQRAVKAREFGDGPESHPCRPGTTPLAAAACRAPIIARCRPDACSRSFSSPWRRSALASFPAHAPTVRRMPSTSTRIGGSGSTRTPPGATTNSSCPTKSTTWLTCRSTNPPVAGPPSTTRRASPSPCPPPSSNSTGARRPTRWPIPNGRTTWSTSTAPTRACRGGTARSCRRPSSRASGWFCHSRARGCARRSTSTASWWVITSSGNFLSVSTPPRPSWPERPTNSPCASRTPAATCPPPTTRSLRGTSTISRSPMDSVDSMGE